jgi:hypothetical protein
MRALTLAILVLSLAGCGLPRDGDDGMDGRGVAAGLKLIRNLDRP